MMTINEEGKALVEQKGFNKEEALKEFMDYVHSYLGDDECDQIMKAFTLADKAHEGQFRASGEPYIMHPLAVAEILAHLQIDHITLIAALLHDVVEDTEYTKEDIENLDAVVGLGYKIECRQVPSDKPVSYEKVRP